MRRFLARPVCVSCRGHRAWTLHLTRPHSIRLLRFWSLFKFVKFKIDHWRLRIVNGKRIVTSNFLLSFVVLQIKNNYRRHYSLHQVQVDFSGPKSLPTSMHSSGMRIALLLTVSQHALCRGVCIPACIGWGVYPSMHWKGRCVYQSMHWAGEVSAQGCVSARRCVWQTPPRTRGRSPVNRMTDGCKNITLPQWSCGW